MRERINNQIRANEVRVISSEGVNLGVLSFKDAFALANKDGLDLIEITPNTNPPIVKIADYGKYKYEQNKKQKKAKAGAKVTETKSIQIIQSNDDCLNMIGDYPEIAVYRKDNNIETIRENGLVYVYVNTLLPEHRILLEQFNAEIKEK